MQLARFLNSVFKKDGFILVDANSKNYIIGNPEKENPIKVKPGSSNLIPTGISIAFPKEFEVQIRPRSGLAAKNNITVLNIAVAIQIILGIITLVTGVEIKYASIHQLGSILVLLSFLFIYYKNTN